MDKLVVSSFISFIFILGKIIETKFIKKEESVNVKQNIRDGLLVYVSSFLAMYIVQYFLSGTDKEAVGVFVGNPSW
tara:strand:- start:1074 stop:1301 length:228 start_codon:yes stop_codon:yes gene_type:complete